MMKEKISMFLYQKDFFVVASKIWLWCSVLLGLIGLINLLSGKYMNAVASGILAFLCLFFSNHLKLIQARIELNFFKNKVIDLEKDKDGSYRVR